MFQEPWSDINDYSPKHANILLQELVSEIAEDHPLFGKTFKILGKREDRDDILVEDNDCFFIVHLSWRGTREMLPYPIFEFFTDIDVLKNKLGDDTMNF